MATLLSDAALFYSCYPPPPRPPPNTSHSRHRKIKSCIFLSKPFPFLLLQSVWISGVSPADWNPVSLRLHFLKCQPQLAECCREIIVDYDLIKQMAILSLHRLGSFHHLLKVLLLQCMREQRGEKKQRYMLKPKAKQFISGCLSAARRKHWPQ